MSLDLSQCSDGELAALAGAGRQDAYREFLARYKAPVYRLIRNHIGDADEALDLTQEAFVAGFAALARYDAGRPFKNWIARIALNKCRDWSRRRQVRRFFFGAAPLEAADKLPAAPNDDAPQQARLAALDAAIASLPAALKEPLLLTAFDELSHAEAGALLGISAKAVETRVYRAKQRLRETLSDWFDASATIVSER